VKVGDLVLENFEGVGLIVTGPYVYKNSTGMALDYDVVLVKFLHGDTFEIDCDELKVISEAGRFGKAQTR
tara:strand:+ start:10 stop:219 length:210 start_codon:yes stop_codon:yes gene_type:complete